MRNLLAAHPLDVGRRSSGRECADDRREVPVLSPLNVAAQTHEEVLSQRDACDQITPRDPSFAFGECKHSRNDGAVGVRAPGRLIVEIEAVRHDAVSKRGRLRRRFTAEPENGSIRSPACIQDNVDHAAYRGLHATAGERYTDDVENGFLGRFDGFLRQVFEPGICNVVGEDMAKVAGRRDGLRISVFRRVMRVHVMALSIPQID